MLLVAAVAALGKSLWDLVASPLGKRLAGAHIRRQGWPLHVEAPEPGQELALVVVLWPCDAGQNVGHRVGVADAQREGVAEFALSVRGSGAP